MYVCVVENQQGKNKFQSGQKIHHNRYGYGIIVGFNSLTNDPVVFFYDLCMQVKYRNKAILVDGVDIL